MSLPNEALQLRSLITEEASLELSLANVAVPEPGPEEVLVRMEAAPINPSDLGLLFGMADMTRAEASGTAESPLVTAPVPDNIMRIMRPRVGKSMGVGNEGAGVVVAAGSSATAQALLGRTVGVIGGEMYSQYRAVNALMCLPLDEGTTPREGASCFVNPLTALGMVETMRLEGHTALVHTAAASNLGQMLNKICLADGVELVNIVRKAEQVETLKEIGAKTICNSSSDSFREQLTDALEATGATLAFDATGGGELAGNILSCMEAALNRKATEYSGYGSSEHKQVYLYGGLDRSPTILKRDYGMAWGLGGWLLTPFLSKIGIEAMQKLQQRVAAEIKTTFASQYTAEVSLAEALTLEAIAVYGAQATGQKYLINPAL
ncbi:MAG: zinc-binding dehydrogenase [Gammaproteobacteria bacterium]|nr:zinc-binding dehydrogenase [Gammaproteobacteria bacterium]